MSLNEQLSQYEQLPNCLRLYAVCNNENHKEFFNELIFMVNSISNGSTIINNNIGYWLNQYDKLEIDKIKIIEIFCNTEKIQPLIDLFINYGLYTEQNCICFALNGKMYNIPLEQQKEIIAITE